MSFNQIDMTLDGFKVIQQGFKKPNLLRFLYNRTSYLINFKYNLKKILKETVETLN